MFHQNGFEIRGGLLKDEPYFVAMDIAKALEYSETAMMLRRLDDDEIMELSADLAGGFSKHASSIKIINESGLYNAILGSKKPQAKAFKKWVTSEVLPSIRKNGSYGSTNTDLLAEHNLLESCAIMADFAQNAHFLAKVLRKLAQKYEANAQFAESRLKSALKHRPDVLKKARNISKDNESSRIELKFFLH